ncbi:MAG: hypothetical protein AABX85_00920 [Nanoarchaeota archaeon]
MAFEDVLMVGQDLGNLSLFAEAYNATKATVLSRAKEVILKRYIPNLEEMLPQEFSVARDEIEFHGTGGDDIGDAPTGYKLSIGLRKGGKRIEDKDVKDIREKLRIQLDAGAAAYGLTEISLHGEVLGLF